MHVGDVGGRGNNRWMRAMGFLRMLGESLRWDDDRLGDIKRIPGDAFEAVYTGPILSSSD